jgi:hypothetical protein
MKLKNIIILLNSVAFLILFNNCEDYTHILKIHNSTGKNIYVEIKDEKKLVELECNKEWSFTEYWTIFEDLFCCDDSEYYYEYDYYDSLHNEPDDFYEVHITWCAYFEDGSAKNCGKEIFYEDISETRKYELIYITDANQIFLLRTN